MSIGYIPEDQEFDDDGIRKLKSVELFEISLVSMPMNEEARITAVKAAPISSPTPVGPSIASIRLALTRKQLRLRGVDV
jgi:phage head maturation protease